MKQSSFKIALVGNPNCGKSSLFNRLTGAKQRTGNWSGVTTEKKTGHFSYQNNNIEVIDLPGIYTLTVTSESLSLDERIACDFILSQEAHAIINIIDASNLERNLYLTTQLLEMNIPIIIALNMMDVAKNKGLSINSKMLAKQLGCPVVALECNKGMGIKELRETIVRMVAEPQRASATINYPTELANAINVLATHIQQQEPSCKDSAQLLAIRLLEDDWYVSNRFKNQHEILQLTDTLKQTLQDKEGEEIDILIAEARFNYINTIASQVLQKQKDKKTGTNYLDKLVLNRLLGIPIFLFIMYLTFLFSINIGGIFQDFFNITSNTIFVQGLSQLLFSWHVPVWFIATVTTGLGKGINTTITFIPVLTAMFFSLAFLEDSGYMARAAFVMDRLMRWLGLPGKSFVPLIVGFGCNVPAIMASRTLEQPRDRVLTIMMTPFMSCGARLAIFAVFTVAFFPEGGQNIIFALYLIGILCAIFTGFLLRHTILKGATSPFVMELPSYHLPTVRTLFHQTWSRLRNFIFKAGRFIIPICILVGALNAITVDGHLNLSEANQNSILSMIGHRVTPLFTPLGIHADNWPATVGLLTGVLAKEVVIATLNTLYIQAGHLATTPEANVFNFWLSLHAALASISDNLSHLSHVFSNPILASAPDHTITQGVFGQLFLRFDGRIGAFAYMLFILLYIPCVSTIAVTARELGYKWMSFSVLWNTSLAYGIAVLFYQAATWSQHPASSSLWIGGIMIYFLIWVIVLKNISILPIRIKTMPSGISLEKHTSCGSKCMKCSTQAIHSGQVQ